MSYIGSKYADLSLHFYRYMSAVAHSNSARKIEKTRAQLLTQSWNTYTDVRTMPIYRGNRALRDSAAAFLKINHRLLKEEYDKILDMEVIAESSYDDMESYIIAQKEARNKLDVANIRMLVEQKKFAADFNIELQERQDELYARMQQANHALDYFNQIYLIFFKSHKQEIYLMDALTAKNIESIEAYRTRLLHYTSAGLQQLEERREYKGDHSLGKACRNILEFYRDEAESNIDNMVNYLVEERIFQVVQNGLDLIPEDERSAEDVEKYNVAVRTLNSAADKFNETNQTLFEQRNQLLEEWQLAYDAFLTHHIPKF